MLGSLAPKLTFLFASVSVLAMIHLHVLAQADDIPDTVVTGSLIRGVTMPPPQMLPRLTQLTEDELNVLLPVSRLSNLPLSGGGVRHVQCDGQFDLMVNALVRTFSTGRYSIRGNQLCLVEANSSTSSCAKLFHSESGEPFYESVGPIEIVLPDRACPRR
jgi:hypothetical protein